MLTQARADGYKGPQIIQEGTVLNFNATVAYLHFHTSGSTNPTTAADGLPLSTDSATAPSSVYTLPQGTDLATTWIHTAGNQTIKYSVMGR